MTLLEAARALKRTRVGQKTAMQSLASRLKQAGLAGDVGSGALEGAGSGALQGAIGGALQGAFSKGGWRGVGYKALTGGATLAVPFAMYGAYNGYRGHKAKQQALRQYQMNGGYGHEFAQQPSPPR